MSVSEKKIVPLVFVFVLLLSAVLPPVAVASPGTTVYVDPLTATVNLGEEFTVHVNVSEAVDLYTWDLGYVTWTPGLLNCTDVYKGEGRFFDPPEPPGYEINNEQGYVWMWAYVEEPSVNGSGTLVSLKFRALATGNCILGLCDVYLEDSTDTIISATVVDGHVAVYGLLEFDVVSAGQTYRVGVFTNSTVTDFGFSHSERQVSFDVTGHWPNTTGFCNVTISRMLLDGDFTLWIDDTPGNYSLAQNATHSHLQFTYGHSTHAIRIKAEALWRSPFGTSWVYSGDPACKWNVTVTVKVENRGNDTEIFDITLYYNMTPVNALEGNPQNVTLAPHDTANVTFTWNLTGLPPCLYGYDAGYYVPWNISANVSSPSLGEVEWFHCSLVVRFPGDGSGDGRATGTDLAILGRSWYKYYPDSKYDWRVDWSGDGKVTGTDLAILARNWYKQAQPA